MRFRVNDGCAAWLGCMFVSGSRRASTNLPATMSSDGGGGSGDASAGPNVRTADGEKLPFDAAAVAELLHSMGVKDYEPRVVHQLLEVYNRT